MSLESHGITEKMALSVLAVFWLETWPRILTARRLHKIDKLKYILSHVRCIPWPHVDAYNDLLEKLVMSRTAAEIRTPILLAKEQVIRRINHNTAFISQIGREQYRGLKLTASDKVWARQIIVQLLCVGPDGEPAAGQTVPWFEEWQWEALKASIALCRREQCNQQPAHC